MDLAYFHLIDRITDLNIGEKTIAVEAQVPQQNTLFEGHFPGYPLMPGVLLIESMAQTSGWLLIALTKFERMPFLAAVKEAWGTRVTTVFPRQGQYAHDAKTLASFATPDVTVDRIGDLLDCDLGRLLTAVPPLEAVRR